MRQPNSGGQSLSTSPAEVVRPESGAAEVILCVIASGRRGKRGELAHGQPLPCRNGSLGRSPSDRGGSAEDHRRLWTRILSSHVVAQGLHYGRYAADSAARVVGGLDSDGIGALGEKLDAQDERRKRGIDVMAGATNPLRRRVSLVGATMGHIHTTRTPEVDCPLDSRTELRSAPHLSPALPQRFKRGRKLGRFRRTATN